MTDEELDGVTAQATQARAVSGMVLLTPNEADALVAEVRRLRALCSEAADWIAAVEEARR